MPMNIHEITYISIIFDFKEKTEAEEPFYELYQKGFSLWLKFIPEKEEDGQGFYKLVKDIKTTI